MSWERARKPEQKAIRREAILNAALRLFSEKDYADISLNAIAKEAGISKPNIYRYFSTREEIFLVIYAKEQSKLVAVMTERIQILQGQDNVNAIVQVWVQTFIEHSVLLNLMPQLAISLERNSSVEQLVKFKHQSGIELQGLLESLIGAYPALGMEQWYQIIACGFSMIVGLWPISNPGDRLLEAYNHPSVFQDPCAFEPFLTFGFKALIQGAIAAKNPTPISR